MKLFFIGFVIIFLAVISRAEPTPEAVAAAKKAEIISYVKGIQAEAKKAKDETASLRILNETIYGTTAKISDALIDAQKGHVTAIIETAKVQREMDAQAATIATQAAKLERWQTFGRVVLACVVGVVFGWVWQLLGKIPLFTTAPYAIAYRFTASLAAGLSAAQCLFILINRLL
jgi:hypothetical protein